VCCEGQCGFEPRPFYKKIKKDLVVKNKLLIFERNSLWVAWLKPSTGASWELAI